MSKSLKVRSLNTFWKKTRGLIGITDTTPVYFETRWGIHTYFLKGPIGVVILDNESRVQSIKVVKPNRTYIWNPLFSRVVEIPNVRAKNMPKVGEKLTYSITE